MQLVGRGPVDVAAIAEYAQAIGPAKQLGVDGVLADHPDLAARANRTAGRGH